MTGKKKALKGKKAKKLDLSKETLSDLDLKKVQGGRRANNGGYPATTCRGSALTCPSDPHCA